MTYQMLPFLLTSFLVKKSAKFRESDNDSLCKCAGREEESTLAFNFCPCNNNASRYTCVPKILNDKFIYIFWWNKQIKQSWLSLFSFPVCSLSDNHWNGNKIGSVFLLPLSSLSFFPVLPGHSCSHVFLSCFSLSSWLDTSKQSESENKKVTSKPKVCSLV